MIDLTVAIRNRLLSDPTIVAFLPDYLGSKPIFSRTPIPSDIEYPVIVISPVVSDRRQDFLDEKKIIITHYIGIWGSNDSPQKYRDVKSLAENVSKRMDRFSDLSQKIITSVASQPYYSPNNDLENGKNSLVKVGFVVSVEFQCFMKGL